MLRVSDLRLREIVNVLDGRRLGLVQDLDIDLDAGRVRGLLAQGAPAKFLGLLGREQDLYIAWEQIIRIGSDVILVELDLPRTNY
ncbi:MAG TPA: YlmC/YmxH family sporulation protein [Firmicutes bacterium]|jgi:YlmC/YmxH family sporulation protein|nr:YlmC/YmxH family sporulation protein [Bacillota bacterium]